MVHLAIMLIILLGLVAIVQIAIRAMGVSIPGWVTQILLVLLVIVVAIFAIRFIATL